MSHKQGVIVIIIMLSYSTPALVTGVGEPTLIMVRMLLREKKWTQAEQGKCEKLGVFRNDKYGVFTHEKWKKIGFLRVNLKFLEAKVQKEDSFRSALS